MKIYPASTPGDMRACAAIWLKSSLAGHPFIPASFWEANLRAMEETYLPAARVYIAADESGPVGFAAVRNAVLEALFVLPDKWGRGVGGALLARLFESHKTLSLNVYAKNANVVAFYKKAGFDVVGEKTCPHSGEAEWIMRRETA